ncbi:TPA: ACP S-malonyltransferase [Candidatus Poribacteria bacterium]|nr:ACP S-malonyltransferase [Candidatus Poribacteria bacterium]
MTDPAFIFPGQGTQKVGMGFDLSTHFSEARAVFEEANSILNWDLSHLCFNGPIEDLTRTENTQLAILTCSVASLRVVQSFGISAKVVAGHSLGEYAALVAAEVIDFGSALKLVQFRSKFMAKSAAKTSGGMAAIIGLEDRKIEQICDQIDGIISIANFNSPGQRIVSGETASIEKSIPLAKSAGAKRIIPLAVSGAFHSDLMMSAQKQFGSVISGYVFDDPKIDFVANVTGDFVKTGEEIKRLLTQQITNPVLWEKSIQLMKEKGISHFIEVGPGLVLSGLVRRIENDCTCFNVEDMKSLEQTLDGTNAA